MQELGHPSEEFGVRSTVAFAAAAVQPAEAIDVDTPRVQREQCPFLPGDQVALHFNNIPLDDFRNRFYTDPTAFGILVRIEHVREAIGGWELRVRAEDNTENVPDDEQCTSIHFTFEDENILHFRSASLKKPQDFVLHHTGGHLYLRRVTACKSSRRTVAASVAFMGDVVLEPLPGSRKGTAAKARDCSLFVKGLWN